MLTRRSFVTQITLLPALGLLATSASAASHKVRIQSMRFAPGTLKIKAGDSVAFENHDSLEHTATALDGSWDTGNLRGGKSATVSFPQKGEYKYYCRWHKAMRGKIIVT